MEVGRDSGNSSGDDALGDLISYLLAQLPEKNIVLTMSNATRNMASSKAMVSTLPIMAPGYSTVGGPVGGAAFFSSSSVVLRIDTSFDSSDAATGTGLLELGGDSRDGSFTSAILCLSVCGWH